MTGLETWRVVAVVVVVVLVIGYAVGSGIWVSTDGGWYRSLTQPSWQPPSWVFGVIWPYNFIALAVVGGVIAWRQPAPVVAILVLFLAASITAALAWAYLFYVPHHFLGSAVALTSAAVLTIPITVVAFRTGWPWGVALLPYQVWVALAASLSWGYRSLNG